MKCFAHQNEGDGLWLHKRCKKILVRQSAKICFVTSLKIIKLLLLKSHYKINENYVFEFSFIFMRVLWCFIFFCINKYVLEKNKFFPVSEWPKVEKSYLNRLYALLFLPKFSWLIHILSCLLSLYSFCPYLSLCSGQVLLFCIQCDPMVYSLHTLIWFRSSLSK